MYFANIGREVIRDEENAIENNVLFDVYVVNRSTYVPNQIIRNGKQAGVGDFGIVNLADDQSCQFDFVFVDSLAGNLYVVSQPFSFYFFDFDTGEEGRLTESVLMCGLDSYRTSQELYGIPTTVVVNASDRSDRGQDCFEFIATVPFSGENNPGFVSEVLAPFVSLSNYTKTFVLAYLVELNFPGGVSGFSMTYTVTAA
eukprot:1174726-Pleurochrysis_carterae.AAC.1